MSSDQEDDLSFTPGALFGSLITMVFTGTYMLITGVLYMPAFIAYKFKHRNDPKPIYRGTVRPARPIAESAKKEKLND